MSGSVASRYVAGVPYGPGRSVGRYPNAASAGTTPGVVTNPVVTPWAPGGGTDLGGVVAPQITAQQIGALGGGVGGGGDSGNMLAALLGGAGLLQYLPDLYDSLFGDSAASTAGGALSPPPEFLSPQEAYDLPRDPASDWGPDATVGPWGLPVVPFGGADFGFVPPGASPWSASGTDGVIWDPTGAAGQLGVTNGWVHPDDLAGSPVAPASGAAASGGGLGSAIANAGGWDAAVQAGTLPTDLGLTGSLGSLPGVGDVATGLADAGGALAGGWMAQGAFKNNPNPNAHYGQQIGSTIGGIAGQILVPIPFLGAAAGAALGGALGGKVGNEIGPNPTIGSNFSTIGTFDGSGGLNWGNAGGDNGGQASDATGFADWFSQNLAQQAAAQGLAFNPNMGGAQIRVGGYDNPSRSGQVPGGYFYDITNMGGGFGGDPDRYALRPSSEFSNDPYSAGQANAFTTNVLADLAARGVYTPGGQAGPDQGYLQSTLGANYGWYGAPGGEYSSIEYGGQGGFNDILSGRQNAVTGYINAQNQQRANEAAGANTAQVFAPGGGYLPGAYDLSQPIFYGNQMLNPGDLGFPDQATDASAVDPWTAVGVSPGLIDPGLYGQNDPGGA